MPANTTAVLTATTDTFDETVLRSDVPVLVDFSAAWCPPCQLLKPVLEEVASEVAGRARVVVVDIDAEPALATHYGVTAIPDLRIFRDGEIVERASGFRAREDLLELLEPVVVPRRAG